MSPNEELMVIFGAMHLVALALGGVLFAMFLRSETVKPWQDHDEGDDHGGGNDRASEQPPKGPRGGGIPLPDAEPSPRRLRDEHARDVERPRPERRKPREPQRTRDPANLSG
jgi:hypothetical protein